MTFTKVILNCTRTSHTEAATDPGSIVECGLDMEVSDDTLFGGAVPSDAAWSDLGVASKPMVNTLTPTVGLVKLPEWIGKVSLAKLNQLSIIR
ncbi:hypothetical protein [Rhizobium multihospitium]|uniref:Uncharacterized protein n=1 Tax=Rhizobium multihospitium TaxID=410764 RepID=A0A1C3XBF5_9HYPH|nr:hypothetical protein [Rhizobium multihospitium]SCB49573.1 hypothetical protein GA0061103_0624 [Rhizobium multihospitium]